MTAPQQRRGLFRMAFAAAAFAFLVMLIPPQGNGSSRAGAAVTLSPVSSSASLAARWSSWERPVLTHATGADFLAFSAILPVLFLGLLPALVLFFVSAARAQRSFAAPSLNSLFQRPPPAQTL